MAPNKPRKQVVNATASSSKPASRPSVETITGSRKADQLPPKRHQTRAKSFQDFLDDDAEETQCKSQIAQEKHNAQQTLVESEQSLVIETYGPDAKNHVTSQQNQQVIQNALMTINYKICKMTSMTSLMMKKWLMPFLKWNSNSWADLPPSSYSSNKKMLKEIHPKLNLLM